MTARSLRALIFEEVSKVKKSRLNEAVYLPDVLIKAADALSQRKPVALEYIMDQFDEMLMDDDSKRAYKAVLQSMVDAAYRLEGRKY